MKLGLSSAERTGDAFLKRLLANASERARATLVVPTAAAAAAAALRDVRVIGVTPIWRGLFLSRVYVRIEFTIVTTGFLWHDANVAYPSICRTVPIRRVLIELYEVSFEHERE